MKRHVTAVGGVALLAVALAGCATGPSLEDVSERFVIEYAGAAGLTDDAARMILPNLDEIAQSAIDGKCGDEEYRDSLVDVNDYELVYAWDSTCLMYFEDDMSTAQTERAKKSIVDEATRRIEESDE